MRVTAMFHPIDRAKLERWALSRGYGCTMEMSPLADGYLLARVEASAGSNHEAVLQDMVNNGVRVMTRPGVLMAAGNPKSMTSGMDRLGEVLREEDEESFKRGYLARLKKASPGQPEKWYAYQADNNWKLHQKHLTKAGVEESNLREDDLWRDAIPGLEKMAFKIGRPGKDGPKYYMIYAPTDLGFPFKPEGVLAFWDEVKGMRGKRWGWEERERVLQAFHKKQPIKHPELGEVVNPFAHGTRIRGMKRKNAGADMALRKRARKLRDGDYYW